MKSKRNTMKGCKSDKIYARKTNKIQKKVNPFDMQVRHDKFKVLNRKTCHNIGNNLAARQKAFEKRKETIGAEYKVKNKANRFADKRRKGGSSYRKVVKESIYNLNENEVLTHHGQTLTDNHDDLVLDDDELSDEEEERLDGNK